MPKSYCDFKEAICHSKNMIAQIIPPQYRPVISQPLWLFIHNWGLTHNPIIPTLSLSSFVLSCLIRNRC